MNLCGCQARMSNIPLCVTVEAGYYICLQSSMQCCDYIMTYLSLVIVYIRPVQKNTVLCHCTYIKRSLFFKWAVQCIFILLITFLTQCPYVAWFLWFTSVIWMPYQWQFISKFKINDAHYPAVFTIFIPLCYAKNMNMWASLWLRMRRGQINALLFILFISAQFTKYITRHAVNRHFCPKKLKMGTFKLNSTRS